MARIATAADLGAARLQGAGGAAQLNLGVAKETGAAGAAIGSAIAHAGNAIGDAVASLSAAVKGQNDAFALPEAQLELETRLSEYDRSSYGNAGEDGSGLHTYADGAKGIATEVYEKYAPRLSPDDQRRYQIRSGYNILKRSETAINESQKLAVGYAETKESQLYDGWSERLSQNGGWANDDAVQNAWTSIRDSVKARVGHTYTADQAAQREKQLLGQLTAQRLQWLADNDPEAFKALEGKASKGIVDESAEQPRVPQGGRVGPQSGLPDYGGAGFAEAVNDRQAQNTSLPASYVDRVKQFEGFNSKPYWDYKQWTSGYGTRAKSKGEVISREEAEKRLTHELNRAGQLVDRFKPGLPEGTRAALVSLTYNSGTKWMGAGLGDAVKSGDTDAIKQRFVQYNKAGGATLPGLVQRRNAEAAWIGKGEPAVADSGGQPGEAGPASEAIAERVKSRVEGVQVADASGRTVPQDQPEPAAEQSQAVPGISVSDVGDTSPEELAARAGFNASVDQETGQAKLALGKEAADQLAKVVEENPDAKVVDYLNDDQIEALKSAGLNVEDMTVSQAASLAQTAAQEQGVQIAQKSSGAVAGGQQGEDPFLGGRLLKGQTFSVKAAGGRTVTFSSEMLNAVSPKVMNSIRKAAAERQRALVKEQSFMADEMMARQLLTVEKTGAGADKFDPNLVRQVYRGTKKIAEFNRQLEVAKRSFEAKKGMADLPDEELQTRLRELESEVLDAEGDADPIIAKTYERTQKAMDDLIKMRSLDPAVAVQETREVKAFVRDYLKNQPPKTAAEMYGLIDARIQAQTKLGITPTPITRREAQQLLEPLVRAGSLSEKREKARQLSQSLRSVYREHAETVMNAALYLNKRDTEDDRLTLNQTFRSLMRETAKPAPEPGFSGRGTSRQDRLQGNPFDRYDRP